MSLFGRSSLRWGRAGPADATVVRWDVRSLSISRIHAGECQYGYTRFKSGWDLVEILRLMVWNVAIQDCLRLHT